MNLSQKWYLLTSTFVEVVVCAAATSISGSGWWYFTINLSVNIFWFFSSANSFFAPARSASCVGRGVKKDSHWRGTTLKTGTSISNKLPWPTRGSNGEVCPRLRILPFLFCSTTQAASDAGMPFKPRHQAPAGMGDRLPRIKIGRALLWLHHATAHEISDARVMSRRSKVTVLCGARSALRWQSGWRGGYGAYT